MWSGANSIKTLWIHKLRILSYGQILTVNLLINCKNFVVYSKMAINYEEKSFMEQAPDEERKNEMFTQMWIFWKVRHAAGGRCKHYHLKIGRISPEILNKICSQEGTQVNETLILNAVYQDPIPESLTDFKALWLGIASHMQSFNQLQCIILISWNQCHKQILRHSDWTLQVTCKVLTNRIASF